jgi:hypothetical protein
MALLEMLIQMVADLVRGFLTDILGRRAERVVDKWLKKRRRRRGRQSYRNEPREKASENKGT